MLDEKRTRFYEDLPDRPRDRALLETSEERFDRIAFAQQALAMLRPAGMTVAICQGVARIRVDSGRQWGAPDGSRWAIVSIPSTASRRAIALAVAGLRDTEPLPYVLDLLLGAHGLGGPAPR